MNALQWICLVWLQCCVCFVVRAQTTLVPLPNTSLTGYWKGYVIYYDEESNKYNSVHIEMKLKQNADSVFGTSFDYLLDPKTYCIADIKGSVQNNHLTLHTNAIQVKRESKGMIHLPSLYHLVYDVSKENLDGEMLLLDVPELPKKNILYPFKIQLSRYQNTYTEEYKYAYRLPKTQTKNTYTIIESQIDEIFNKIIHNKKEEANPIRKPQKAIVVLPSAPKKTNLLANTQKKPAPPPLVASSNNTPQAPKNLTEYIDNIVAKAVKKTAAEDSMKDEQAKSTVSKDTSMVDVYSLKILNTQKIEKIKKQLETNTDLFALYKKIVNRKWSDDKYTFEFLDSLVFFSMQNEQTRNDTVALFINKELVEPSLVITSKPVFFQLHFENENIMNITLANLGTQAGGVQIKMILEDKAQQSVYEAHIQNSPQQNTKLTFYFNENESLK